LYIPGSMKIALAASILLSAAVARADCPKVVADSVAIGGLVGL
jgi:hypothetical protein